LIHVADDADAACGGRPYCEVCSSDSSHRLKMRAEFFVGVEMAAFADEVEIEVGEEERESIGIEDFKRLAGMSAALNFVAAGFRRGGLIGGPDGFEEALGAEFDGIGNFCGRDGGILENDAGFGGPGNEEAYGPARGNGMRTEDAERISIRAGKKRVGAQVKIGERLCFRRQR
jgi:hypothetical protein